MSVRPWVRPSVSVSGAITQKPQYQLPSNFTHVFLTTVARHGANFDFRKSTVTDWRPFLLLAMHYHNRRLNMVEMPVYIASIMYMQALLWATIVGQN